MALTELIIPETDTPGAKAVHVNRYIDLVVNEEEANRQRVLLQGLAWIDVRSLKLHGQPFVQLGTAEQTHLLAELADPSNPNPEDQPGVRFFEEIKHLTLFGHHTLQDGMVQELR